MNLIFLRHGEATDNVKELISDKEIYWSILTNDGVKTVKETIKELPDKIDKIYVSPLPRTIETAHYVNEKYPNVEVIIDNRIREIYYGKYSHQKNNEDLDNIRLKQIAGDYFVRFGEYGENKFEIENRLCDFLNDIFKNNKELDNIVIISHGSIIAYMKRILDVRSSHIKKGKIDVFNDVDFDNLFKHIEMLKEIKNEYN